MNRIQLTRNVLAAAVIGAMGTAFAQTSATTAAPQASESKPLCSSLNHPNAGKHADKSTGMAKERSSSPVHMDCVPDSSASTANGTTAAGAAGTAGTGASASSSPSASTGVNASGSATASPSVTGSSSTQSSAITGSTTDQNTSITGSTSTFNPTIDLRGRSS